MHVADLGAGSGFFARAAARLVGEQGLVWAVDLNRELLPRIQNLALGEGLRNVEVMCGDLEKEQGTHLPEGSIDFVILTNVLFAIDNKYTLLQEVRRILRPGGRVLVADWSGTHGGLGPQATAVVERAAARDMCAAAGLSHERDVPAGAYHWGFIVRKKGAKAPQ